MVYKFFLLTIDKGGNPTFIILFFSSPSFINLLSESSFVTKCRLDNFVIACLELSSKVPPSVTSPPSRWIIGTFRICAIIATESVSNLSDLGRSFDSIQIDGGGNNERNISVPDTSTLTIQVWDTSLIKNIDVYRGRRLGVKIKNYNLTSLTKDTTTIKEFSKGKKFILLDFWGTWCVPCLELLPNLKKFHQENDNVSIISIALDESIDVVKDYSEKEAMYWNHAYVDRNNRKGIITDLRVESYLTFILLNDKLKILYKGAGETALENIEKILRSKK